MEGDSVLEALLAYGADPEVLEEYDCLPRKARVHHDVLKLRTDWGACSLKKVNLTPAKLWYVHGCTEHVYANRDGDMFVPRMIRNRYGDPFVTHSSGLYYMTNWHSGREADLRKAPELEGAASALGRWHAAASGWKGNDAPEYPNVLERLQRARGQLEQFRETSVNEGPNTSFERLFASCADELMARLDTALKALAASSYVQNEARAKEQGWICHGNLGRPHIVYDGSSYTLLSYDRVQPGAPVNDLALLLHRYMPAYGWEPDVLARTISAYRSTAPEPFVDDERLRAILAAPLRSLQVVLWYFTKSRGWDEEDFVDYLEASLELEEARHAAGEAVTEAVLSEGLQALPPVKRTQTSLDTPEERWFQTALAGDTRRSAESDANLERRAQTATRDREEADFVGGFELPVQMNEHSDMTAEAPKPLSVKATPASQSSTGTARNPKKPTAGKRKRQARKRTTTTTSPRLWSNERRDD